MASLQKRKIKGNSYWYVVESKRINGKPTPIVTAYLGTVDNILSRCTSGSGNMVTYNSRSHGAVFALWKTAEKYGFIKTIDSLMGGREKLGISAGEAFLLASLYRYLCGDENTDFMEWLRGTTLPSLAGFDPDRITDDFIWHYTENITDEQLTAIESALTGMIISHCRTLQPFCFTHGSYFNFIAASHEESGRRSQTRQKKAGTTGQDDSSKNSRDKLNQYNLEVVMERRNPFPLSAKISKNSLYCIKPQPNISSDIHEIFNNYSDGSKFTIVFDRTANARENIRQIIDSGFNYICAASLNNARDLVDIPLDKYSNTEASGKTISYLQVQRNIFSSRQNCVVFFNQKQKESQIKRLNRDINEKIEKLEILREQLKSSPKAPGKRPDMESRVKGILAGNNMEDMIEVTYTGKNAVTDFKYEINEKVYDEICTKYFGKRLLVTNHMDWDAASVIDAYTAQSDMERMFKYTMKHWNLPMKEDFVWSDLKIRVHIFCCMLGLTLCGLLQKELSEAGIPADRESLISKLNSIRENNIHKQDQAAKSDTRKGAGNGAKNSVKNDVKNDTKRRTAIKDEKALEIMNNEQQVIWDKIKEILCQDEL